jgi:hypothetical protein
MFDDLDSSGIVFFCLIGTAIWLWMWYEIIKSAVSSALRKENERLNQHLTEHTRLLSELLKHSGVDEQRIHDVLDFRKAYFLGNRKDENKSN